MKKYLFIPLAITCLSVLIFSNCKKTAIREATTEDENILEYLQKDSSKRFSEFITLVDKAGFNEALSIYGTYTLFAPTNEGVDAHLKTIGKSLDQVTPADAQQIVK